jgi:hypothetical protein
MSAKGEEVRQGRPEVSEIYDFFIVWNIFSDHFIPFVELWLCTNVTHISCKRCHFNISCPIVTNLGSMESFWHRQSRDNDKNIFCLRPKAMVFGACVKWWKCYTL